MDDERNVNGEVDNMSNATTEGSMTHLLPEYRKNMIGFTNRLRRIRDTLEGLLSDVDPVELDLDELQEYKDVVAAIKKDAVTQSDVLFQEEVDEALRTGDESKWQALESLMRKVSSLSEKLASIKIAQSWVRDVDRLLEALILRVAANPGMDFEKGMAGLVHANEELSAVIRKSTIPIDHPIRKTASEMNARIVDLQATEKVDAPPPPPPPPPQ